uniref:Putative acetyltransferase n=1 Tax=viral metagenome TaxID=1070528 RepID=A0A6M3KF12_9ZZZZ
MEIRKAEIDDIPLLAKLGRQFHEDAGFSSVQSYDEKGFQESLMNIVDNPLAILITMWEEEAFVGALSGGLFPNFFAPSETIAQSGFLCVMPEFRKSQAAKDLTGIFEKWAENMGASIVTYFGNTQSLINKFRKRGFKKTDTVMSLRIKE